MRRQSGSRLGSVLCLSLVLGLGSGLGAASGSAVAAGPAVSAGPAEPAPGPGATPVGLVTLPRPVHGARAVRLLGDRVDAAAELNDTTTGELTALLRSDRSAWLDTRGALFYREPAPTAAPAAERLVASAPLGQTFLLHSLPGASKTIFLDFDGGSVSATAWHQDPAVPTTQPAWDLTGDPSTFDATEREAVQAVWASVAEDYAAFDVDVTTADPGPAAIYRSSATDQTFGSHALITPSDAAASALCGSLCGGLAYVGVFGAVDAPGGDGYGAYQPAWIFPQLLGDSPKFVAEAVSHEVGHHLGLGHDGNAGSGYDEGHDPWAPIMGVGYFEPVSQWSKGDYAGADNPQDDVAILRGVLGPRADEAGDTVAGAAGVPAGPAYVSSRTDVDTYLLGTCGGSVTVSADVAASFADLDASLSLLDASGTVLATDDPASAATSESVASGMGASLTRSVPAGTYYASVDGVGHGDWPTGYDDYGSLGAYTLDVSGCDPPPPADVPSVPLDASATPVAAGAVRVDWAAPASPGSDPVSGYLLTRSGDGGEVRLGPDERTHTWTGLAPGTSYTFTVAALNARGAGPTAVVEATTAARAPTATSLAVDVVRRTVTLAAGVTAEGSEPAGVVRFAQDGVVLDAVPLVGGAATLTRTAVAAGTHAWTATFVPADATAYAASVSAPRAATLAPTTTRTALTGVVSGSSVTLTTTVTGEDGIVPAGQLKVWDGATPVGTVPLAAGRGTLVLTGVAAGAHAYRADFGATPDLAASTSPDLTLTVGPAVVPSTTTLTAPRTARAGTRPTVRVRVLRGSVGAAGQVVLSFGTRRATLTLSSGAASLTLPRVRRGRLVVTAAYGGNATTSASSATRTIAVR